MSPEPDQPDATNEQEADDGPVELRFATMDQLVAEIWKRSRASVLMAVGLPDDDPDDDDPPPSMWHHGTNADQHYLLLAARRRLPPPE
jgi:hypothetical protein